MSTEKPLDAGVHSHSISDRLGRGCLERLYRNSITILIILLAVGALFALTRDSIYKIRPYERGLHLRGGRFVGVDLPGWHFKIPFVDTVIGVTVIERGGMIEKLAVMTSDDVTMDVSLMYTYRVEDPVRFQLEVLNPEQIVSGFVQGTLRDVVNTRDMDEVMHSRAIINQEVMDTLEKKQEQYGVRFVLIQIQSASPPEEVVNAIKNRMVAVQLQEQAVAEAIQQKTLADSAFYTAQKEADAEAYQITRLAEARREALREVLAELQGNGAVGEAYIQVLMAEALSQNSKWIVSNGGTMPVIDLRETGATPQPTPTSPN